MSHLESDLLIFAVGTQVVIRKEVYAHNNRVAHPAGAVGVIVQSPLDRSHAYRIRFADSFESPVHHDQLVRLADFKREQIGSSNPPIADELYDRIIFRCVIGSRAYGLEGDESDTDRRGVFLPTAEMHWSLYGVPEQLENEVTQECYWELQKFLVLALKANPNVLECLYSPIVEKVTPIGHELLQLREAFLSKLVFQTYSGYVASQFKKMQADVRNHGTVKWKHVMHLIRLLMSGITVLNERHVMVQVGEHRDSLLSIKRGEVTFEAANRWRIELQQQFEAAFETTDLPERPDYERVNEFLVRARKSVIDGERLL